MVAGFLGKYCIQCHDAGTAEGEREFDSFALPIASEQQLITVDEIIDQVTLKLMPPEDSEQPTDEERVGPRHRVAKQYRAGPRQVQKLGWTHRDASAFQPRI